MQRCDKQDGPMQQTGVFTLLHLLITWLTFGRSLNKFAAR